MCDVRAACAALVLLLGMTAAAPDTISRVAKPDDPSRFELFPSRIGYSPIGYSPFNNLMNQGYHHDVYTPKSTTEGYHHDVYIPKSTTEDYYYEGFSSKSTTEDSFDVRKEDYTFEEDSKIKEPKDSEEAVNPYAVLYGKVCGGTIISSTWILTAAHCTIYTSGSTVVAGTNNTKKGVVRKVKRILFHPLFSVGPYWLLDKEFGIQQIAARWDFLLVELTVPLPLDDETMKAAILDDKTHTIPGLDVVFSGFGAHEYMNTMQQTIHHSQLTTLSDNVCQNKLPEYNSQDMMCAKGRPPRFDSACSGDSGSGLIAGKTLYGVLSWVEKDAVACKPGSLLVFSRVAAVRDWIRQVTKI